MPERVVWKPIKLSDEEFEKKLKSENIMDKFDAISDDIQNRTPDNRFLVIRLLTYLEFMFDKVIEEKISDRVARDRLWGFRFFQKMELMKDWELLIGENYQDVDTIRQIRNDFAHKLWMDWSDLQKKIENLNRYGDETFKGLDSTDRVSAIIIDIMGIFTTAINTHFEYKPTPKA